MIELDGLKIDIENNYFLFNGEKVVASFLRRILLLDGKNRFPESGLTYFEKDDNSMLWIEHVKALNQDDLVTVHALANYRLYHCVDEIEAMKLDKLIDKIDGMLPVNCKMEPIEL